MAVLILHPTEELIFAKLQKQLISDFFVDGRVMYAVKPLWIEIEDTRWLSSPKGVSKPQSESDTEVKCSRSSRLLSLSKHENTGSHQVCGFDTASGLLNHRSSIELGDLQASNTEILIPITITADDSTINTKLTLVKIHSGKEFTDTERQKIAQKKQPVRQLKIFRLGIEKELSPVSKCITDSKWIKLK